MAGEATSAALGLLEGAVNRCLALDPESLRRMAAFEGRVIGLDVSGLGMRLYLLPGPGGVQILGSYEGTPDTVLRGSPAAFARLGLGGDAAAVLFAGDVRIEGDTELGQRFKAVLDDLQVDWEGQLARLIGDVAAHQVARGARALGEWGRQTAASLEQDLGEYLQEETGVLPPALEVEGFLDAVDELRADADRLEARVRRLEAALGAAPGGRSETQ